MQCVADSRQVALAAFLRERAPVTSSEAGRDNEVLLGVNEQPRGLG